MADVATVPAPSCEQSAEDAANLPIPAEGDPLQQQQEEEVDDEEEYKAMAEACKDQGNAAFKAGQYDEAVSHYSRGLDVDPDNHFLYSNRSAAFIKINERGRALKDAEKLMELKPDWCKSYSRKAAAQHALTRYQAAMETYYEGLRQFPEDSSLRTGLQDVEKDYEKDKVVRFERARIEREEQAKRKAEEIDTKKKQQQTAAKVAKKEEKAKAPSDDLADFFSSIGGDSGSNTNGKNTSSTQQNGTAGGQSTMREDYARANLGKSEDQIARLLQPNYAWKNLNPYEVLQLDTDATEDDIKLRYRKLSTLVHPDKCLTIENARDAFEEVKKAYNTLMEEERRKLCEAIVEETRRRTLKERKQKLSKGVSIAQLGPEEEAVKKAIMKEFAEMEMRKRNAEKHAKAHAQREQAEEDAAKQKMKHEIDYDKSWTNEDRQEGRVGNWRDFQKGPGAKRARVQAWATEENVKEKPKYGQYAKEEWKKKWK